MSRAILLALAGLLGLPACAAAGKSIEVLWYTYAHPESVYIRTVQELADKAHALPRSSGLRWRVTFFRAGSPAPSFKDYNVLVIHSGEPFFTARQEGEAHSTPDYAGILKNRTAIEAARGERTFITGADADVHMIAGNTGNAPVDPVKELWATCRRPVSPRCWDGALGHLVNAVNWAGSGRGLGIVSLVAGEHPAAGWWLHPDSFLRAELMGSVAIWGPRRRENDPEIPPQAQRYSLNAGLTSKGLSNWNNSFHGGFSQPLPGYAAVVVSARYRNTALAVATASFALAAADGPAAAPARERRP